MTFYLMTDLEGVAGVYQWENRDDTSRENHERRCRQRVWLAEEVNAAVDGFYTGGADEVIVNDGHGAGYSIDLDVIDPRPQIIHGQNRPFWLPFLDETCDATGIVGGHAKAGTPNANLCHTMSSAIRDWQFNGISLGEMGLQAAIAGHYGVPFTFCSGDAHACKEMEELIGGCVTVPVKWGTSTLSALTLPPQEARTRIREGAERALEVTNYVELFDLGSPVHFRDERKEPTFDEEEPGDFTVIDAHTREIEAENIIELMYLIYDYPRDWQPLNVTLG
ncbi:MAG: M55 family metallopeptidase [Armatimonadota bacterium]